MKSQEEVINVLLVNDESPVLEGVQDELEKRGHVVTVVRTFKEGMEASRERIDLLLGVEQLKTGEEIGSRLARLIFPMQTGMQVKIVANDQEWSNDPDEIVSFRLRLIKELIDIIGDVIEKRREKLSTLH